MKTAHFLRKDDTSSQDLSVAALSYQTNIGRARKIESVSVKFSVAVTETVTVTLVSASGAVYNAILSSKGLIAATSYIFRPDGELNLQAGDELLIACTNANGIGIAYVTIKASEL